MDITDLYEKFIACNQELSTDTRRITPGSMFFAWKGEVHDGNTFAGEALEKGARYVVIDNPDFFIDERTLVVKDSIQTLQHLARYHRQQFQIPVIAIGGSNGKTTTKELVAQVLATQKDVVASLGSLNNHVGVPLTLLRMNTLTDIVVVEMGANHVGEIQELCTIAEPTHGLITNIGRDHIGLFGNQEAIIVANTELYNYLRDHGGHVFVNKNNMTLMKYAQGIEQTCYGEDIDGEFGIRSQHTAPYVSFLWKHHTVNTHLTGEYNLENIVGAISIGVHFNIIEDNIITAIESYLPNNNRSELVQTDKGNIIIKDFYNANATSMKFALQNLADVARKYPDKKSIAILGDMLELGEFSIGEHQDVLDFARSLDFEKIILVGPDFKQTEHVGIECYLNIDEVISTLQKSPPENATILLKASHGTNFTQLFNGIEW